MVVLVTGGREPSGESRADEAASQLVERYGLPASAVVPIGGLGSTLGNAGATAEYIKSHSAAGTAVKNIYVLTNNYHMLRAWVIFSFGMLKALRNQDPCLSATDGARLKRLLRDGLPESRTKWSEREIAATRERVIELLKPYFKPIGIDVDPLVVEEILERNGAAKRRYASLLRNNKWVLATLEFEYQGIRNLLLPKKQRKDTLTAPSSFSINKQ
jgi:hypothetical protein